LKEAVLLISLLKKKEGKDECILVIVIRISLFNRSKIYCLSDSNRKKPSIELKIKALTPWK
jgi:hypothetical protein